MEEERIGGDDYYPDELEDSGITREEFDSLIANQERLSNSSMGNFSGSPSVLKDSNFLHVQISTDELLLKLRNYYSGAYEDYDSEGNKVYKLNEGNALFNAWGVSSLMEIISKYIDKGTILSSYREERIFEIVADIADEINLFILSNYKKMGMDTYEKKTKFRLIIVSTAHIIESAYRRALHGHTLDKLNDSTAIHQFKSEPQRYGLSQQKKQGFMRRIFS